MKKLFLFVLLLLISSISNAKYTFYWCSKGDAPSCSGACKIEESWVVDFNINTQNNTIIRSDYIDKKLKGTRVLDDCKIVDKKNWQCGKYEIMANDTWYVEGSDDGIGMCGKYSIFK